MEPTEFYKTILEEIEEGDKQTVARIMAEHVGEDHLIDLKTLTVKAFGKHNISTERKTRMILEELVTKHRIPVCAYSGKPGRWLAADETEREKVVADLEARSQSLQKRISSLKASSVPVKKSAIHEFYEVKQIGLWS